jgi:hypothetical protein
MASVGLSGACLGVQLEFTEGRLQESVRLTTDMRARAVFMTQAHYSRGHRIAVGWALGD